MPYSKDYIKQEIRKLVSMLEKDNILVQKIILFGSYANNNPTEWSDVDVALISDDFCGIRFYDIEKIAPYLIQVEPSIEVHPYRTDEFDEDKSFFVHEILKNGMEIEI